MTPEITIEAGGRKKGCRPSLGLHQQCFDVTSLPNPYKELGGDESPPRVLAWLQERAREAVDRIVAAVVAAIDRGESVRVECHGGRHRSRAIAFEVQRHRPKTRLIELEFGGEAKKRPHPGDDDSLVAAAKRPHHNAAAAKGGKVPGVIPATGELLQDGVRYRLPYEEGKRRAQ